MYVRIIILYIYDREFIITKTLLVIICDYHSIIGLIIVYYIVQYYWIIFSIKRKKRKKKKNYMLRATREPQHIVFYYMLRFSCCPQHSVPCSVAVLNPAFKIGHLLLSLMLGAKIAAYYGQKTAANKVLSTSERPSLMGWPIYYF